MSHPFDATLKEIFSPHPADFAPVYRFPPLKPAQPLNVDLSTLSAATDLAFGFGAPLKEIVDLNFQSGPDATLPSRVRLYNAALHFRYQVPVRSVAILLRPKANFGEVTGKLAYVCGGKQVEFEYDVVRMWEEPLESYLHGGLALLPLATLCQLPEGKPLQEALREVVREIQNRLLQETDHAQGVRLMTAAFILTGLRVPKKDLPIIYDGVRIMHESTAFDEILDEGRLEGEVRLLLRLGQKRFGLADLTIQSALKAIKDLERLERMGEAILTVNSWQEVLATP